MNDIRIVLQGFQTCSVEHVKRGANAAAHGLAKTVVNDIIDKIWMEEIPSCIFDVVLSKLFALSVYNLCSRLCISEWKKLFLKK